MTPDEPIRRFALVLERSSPRRTIETGRILASHLSIPRPDAVARVRYGGGLLAEDLTARSAAELAADLQGIGVRTRTVDAARWAVDSPGYQALALEFLEDTLLVRLQTGRELVVPRKDIFGIDVYLLAGADRDEERDGGNRPGRRRADAPAGIEEAVPRVADDDEPVDGLLLSQQIPQLSPRAQVLLNRLRKEEYAAMELRSTLFCAEPTGRLHLRRDRFDYSLLGEQKRPHSIDNFLLLLEDLLERVPGAWNRESVEKFLRELDPSSIARFKPEEVQNFHRWMLLWIRLETEESPPEKGGAL